MWIWLVAAVLSLASWLIVWLLPVPLWVAIAVTLVAFALALAAFLVGRLRARNRALALERELLKQAGAQADRSRPDRRAEILELQAQMKQAIDALKRSKLGAGGGQAALHAHPWYVIVGPPAAGKTTALEQSGLAFTTPAKSGPKIRGTAGTRNCDWWFSQHAILLDTAGRFATEDDDRDEWLAFLDTLKRFRRGKPLDGVIVAISVTDLLGADETRIEELAKTLRARVDEMMSRLDLVLPVYVMFTKTDLVGGFVEFWSDLGKQQRGQPWGATFALDDERLDEPGLAFESEFDVLVGALHARLLERLPRERSPEIRARILQFPAEFQLLRTPLSQLLRHLCANNPYQETPILRGFYFTSGTQVGRPLDKILGDMERGFGLRVAPQPDRQPATQAQSYFVTDVLKGIVFPDRHLATHSGAHQRRALLWDVALGGGAVIGFLVAAVWCALSFLDARDLARATGDAAMGVKRAGGDTAGFLQPAGAGALSSLLDRVTDLQREQERLRVPGWPTSTALYEPARALLFDRLRATMEGPVRAQVRSSVEGVANLQQISDPKLDDAYAGLRLYAMLAQPSRLEPEWAAAKLADHWARAGSKTPPLDAAKLATQTRVYADAVAADQTLAWPDEPALLRARVKVCSELTEKRQLRALEARLGPFLPVRVGDVFAGPAAPYAFMQNDYQVPGFFTKTGWNKLRGVLASKDPPLVREGWVCGEPDGTPEAARKESAERLRRAYFSEYQTAWERFFKELRVRPPSDLRSAVEELRVLEQHDGPYARLLRVLTDNVTLDLDEPGLLDRAMAKGKEMAAAAAGKDAEAQERPKSPVEVYFKPLVEFAGGAPGGAPAALPQYLKLLTTLEVSLGQLKEGQEDAVADFRAQLKTTKASVGALFGGMDGTMRGLIEPALTSPIRFESGASDPFGLVTGPLNAKWKSDVWPEWSEKLAKQYPFAPASPTHAALDEFVAFFRPGAGTFWKFFDASLKDSVVRHNDKLVAKERARVPLTGDALSCLTTAQEITDAVFGTGQDPAVFFAIRMRPAGPTVAEISLLVDGVTKVYRNEPEKWVRMQWPGKEATVRGATVTVRGEDYTDKEERLGAFGFFQLLELGKLKPLPGSTGDGGLVLTASWTIARAGRSPVEIDFRPEKSVHPFKRDFFSRMKCPEAIAPGGAAPP